MSNQTIWIHIFLFCQINAHYVNIICGDACIRVKHKHCVTHLFYINWNTKPHAQTKEKESRCTAHRSIDKTSFFLLNAIPTAADRQAVAPGARGGSKQFTPPANLVGISLTTQRILGERGNTQKNAVWQPLTSREWRNTHRPLRSQNSKMKACVLHF